MRTIISDGIFQDASHAVASTNLKAPDSSEQRILLADNPMQSSISPQTSKESPKFMWIHVPCNNPPWVRKVFETLEVHQRRDFSELWTSEHWLSRHTRGRHLQHHACFLKSTCAFTSQKLKKPKSDLANPEVFVVEANNNVLGSIPRNLVQGCLYLYMPFLHFDSYKMLIRRRDVIRKRTQQGRTFPIPREVQEDSSFELKMIWEFLGDDPPINCRRTLDQYRYPSLHDTRARDDDQMLYKMTKQNVYRDVLPGQQKSDLAAPRYHYSSEADIEEGEDQEGGEDSDNEQGDDGDVEESDILQDVLDGNVLMVDQLWLWSIDTSKFSRYFFFLPPLCFCSLNDLN